MGIFKKLFGGGQWEHNKETTRLYNLYKEPFVRFALRYYPVDEATARDVYQESFMILYQNIREGKYVETRVSLKTYLFEIGKHRICKLLDRNRILVTNEPVLASEWMDLHVDADEWMEAQEIVARLVGEADEACSKVLALYYWEKQSMEDIARHMNYKTGQVAKNKKSSCLRRLAFELKKRLEAAGIYWNDKESVLKTYKERE